MKTWRRALKDALIAGSVASLTSTVVLALRGRSDTGGALGPLNAPSHWLWGDRALAQDDASLRYTATGLLIHHASSIFWAIVQERLLHRKAQSENSVAAVLRDAAITTALAALVDLRLVPKRLTPGFERRLSGPSLAGVYSLFAIGLAIGSSLAARHQTQ
jgi:hypothetical protein